MSSAAGFLVGLCLPMGVWAQDASFQVPAFQVPMERVAALMASSGEPGKVVDALAGANARLSLFQMKELFRLYADRYGSVMKEDMDTVHALDRRLGLYVDLKTRLAFAQSGGAPSAMLDVLQAQERAGRATLGNHLLREGWMNGRVMRKLSGDLQEVGWDSNGKGRDYLLSEMAERLKAIRKGNYDVSSLDGMHALRRALRSVIVEAQAVNGLIVLDKKNCPLPEYRPHVEDSLIAKYLEFSRPLDEARACRISDCLYRDITEMAYDLGNAKDSAEMISGYARAALKSGVASSPAQARDYAQRMVASAPIYSDPSVVGPAINAGMRNSRVLKLLAKQLLSCRN